MRVIEAIKGRVVYASSERLWLARGSHLLESRDGGDRWRPVSTLPVGPWGRVRIATPLLNRLTRSGVHHFIAGDTSDVVVADRQTWCFDGRRFTEIGSLQGSRPVCMCSKGDVFYYGEYRSNPKRVPIRVWQWRPSQHAWSPVWTFDGVRHVHGVFHDPYTNALWVTTGDEDRESAIWRTDDDFKTLRKIAGGSQQLRAVQLLFTKHHVYFGSDTPDDQNYLYRIERIENKLERLVEVGSSVFFGCKINECLFFSTAVEPSQCNYTRQAELWGSCDGSSWKRMMQFRKDRWSMKYFQYGQLLFPGGAGDSRHLYVSPFALEGHGTTLKLDVSASSFSLAGS